MKKLLPVQNNPILQFDQTTDPVLCATYNYNGVRILNTWLTCRIFRSGGRGPNLGRAIGFFLKQEDPRCPSPFMSQLFRSYIRLSIKKNLHTVDHCRGKPISLSGPVVRRVNRAIHWINNYQRITQLVFVLLILWIAIYQVDSAIQLLNNRGGVNSDRYLPGG